MSIASTLHQLLEVSESEDLSLEGFPLLIAGMVFGLQDSVVLLEVVDFFQQILYTPIGHYLNYICNLDMANQSKLRFRVLLLLLCHVLHQEHRQVWIRPSFDQVYAFGPVGSQDALDYWFPHQSSSFPVAIPLQFFQLADVLLQPLFCIIKIGADCYKPILLQLLRIHFGPFDNNVFS